MKLRTTLTAVSKAGLYAILFTPLLYSTSLVNPSITSKVLGFQILVDIVLAAAAICWFLEPGTVRFSSPLLGLRQLLF